MPSRLPENVMTFGKPRFRGGVHGLANGAQALVPVLLAIESLGDAVALGGGADQIVFFQGGVSGGFDQVDAFVPELCANFAKLFQGKLRITPLAKGLVDMMWRMT